MAEQAINTIYLLGEQPDSLCGELVKNFTERVFSVIRPATPSQEEAMPSTPKAAPVDLEAETPMPASQDAGEISATPRAATPVNPAVSQDPGSSYTLAQLVFVVGHVAIKHIVYLELVEREFKRRKDEKAKGESRRLFKGDLRLTIL